MPSTSEMPAGAAAGKPAGARARGWAALFYAAQFFFGGWFLFHGLNHWLQFFVQPSGSGQGMRDLISVLIDSGMFDVVKAIEVVAGVLLLVNRFVPLAIAVSFPITIVISFMNFTMGDHFGIVTGIISILLNITMAVGYLDRYLPMLVYDAEDPGIGGLQRLFREGLK